MSRPSTEEHANGDAVPIRPALGRFLVEWLGALLLGLMLYTLLASDVAAAWGLVVIFVVVVPFEYRTQSITLTPSGLRFRTGPFTAHRELPWPLVRAVSLGSGPFRSITLDLVDPRPATAHSERYRLRFGRGSLLLRRTQEAAAAQIEQWWVAHRDADLPRIQEPLRFPPDANPYAPPSHD